MKFVFTILFFCISSVSILSQEPKRGKGEYKPLLRVFPIYRPEECEMGIRPFICLKCIFKGEKYAQKIYFYEDGPYREHGCFTDEKGFYIVKSR